MNTNEIRNAFLEYFRGHGHEIVSSSSLVPAGDPTLLFTNAGMVQFKDCFLGVDKRSYVRAVTCQKCLRISGKHNDLENVGRTARHHTFFEMLGNFSFGDYFKKEAIEFGWEFLTKTLGLSKERLWVTIYQEDDEAKKLWEKHTDVSPDRVLRFGKEDNFWSMGETGPCGPCSEIHYYLGDDVKNQSEEAFRKNDGTYVEIWNLVFMQFNRDLSGTLHPLPKPAVDTGMGLERIAAVKQGVRANYDTDLLRRIIEFTEKISQQQYLGKDYTARDPEQDPQYGIDVAMRVIADHVRAVSFLIADDVNPGSDGRGYVLRRLIRRACRHGKVLGFREPFLYQVASEVVSLMSGTYPQLQTAAQKISKVIKLEEEKFIKTLDSGLEILKREVSALKQSSGKVFPGNVAFLLHDTYGFPLDLTQDIVRADGLFVNEEEFSSEMEKQRERSRSARASEAEQILLKIVKPRPTKFVGYEFEEYESEVVGLFTPQGEVKKAHAEEEVVVVSSETPFYAESGGQVGDIGSISSNNASLEVLDTQKLQDGTIVHICRVKEGELVSGERVRLSINAPRRKKIRIHHSATHLLHAALREVLGSHVKQAGSRVSEKAIRFDITHYEAISQAQLEEIEQVANELIRSNEAVITDILPVEEAKKSGAIALFGEKYGDLVRVVQIGPRSRELCGGTHAQRSGDIGLLSTFSEGAISAGVRRIEAYAGESALEQVLSEKRLIKEASQLLKVGVQDFDERLKRVLERNKDLERELSRLQQSANTSQSGDLFKAAKTSKDGTKVIASVVSDASPAQLREVADSLKARLQSACIALAGVSEGRVVMLTAVTEDLTGRFHAGKMIEEMAKIVGSKGGGRPDLAQAGGGDASKLEVALKRFEELVL